MSASQRNIAPAPSKRLIRVLALVVGITIVVAAVGFGVGYVVGRELMQ